MLESVEIDSGDDVDDEVELQASIHHAPSLPLTSYARGEGLGNT
ncbi:hypothetical protein MIMGU_mgv1a0173373mg, partial [Erythranthe guttata]